MYRVWRCYLLISKVESLLRYRIINNLQFCSASNFTNYTWKCHLRLKNIITWMICVLMVLCFNAKPFRREWRLLDYNQSWDLNCSQNSSDLSEADNQSCITDINQHKKIFYNSTLALLIMFSNLDWYDTYSKNSWLLETFFSGPWVTLLLTSQQESVFHQFPQPAHGKGSLNELTK